MRYPEITRLYKFYAYNENSLSVLQNRTVWFARPNSLNDPFDCKIPFDNGINRQELKKFLPIYKKFKGISEIQLNDEMKMITDPKGQINPEFMKVWTIVLEKAEEQLRNSGIFCLSQCNANVLMWSHYADNHKGFCIEFVRSSQNDLGNYEKTRRVKYTRNYPIISPINEKAYDLKFFTKSIDWKYEKEWRMLNEEGNIAFPLPDDIDISAIFFGINTPTLQMNKIIKIVSNVKKVKFFKANKVPNKFKIDFVEI